MKQLLIILAAFITFNVTAQNPVNPLDSTNAKYAINLENGRTIYANDLSENYSYHNRNRYLVVNNREHYGLDSIKSYRSSKGFFQKFPLKNTPDVASTWFKREELNKINIYSKRQIAPNFDYVPIGLDGSYVPISTGYGREKKAFFMQVGDELPKIIIYNNLKNVVYTNPQSLKLINKANTLSQIRPLLVIAGAAMMITGLVQGSCNTEVPSQCERVDNAKSGAIFLTGTALCCIPLLLPKPKTLCREAVYLFNK